MWSPNGDKIAFYWERESVFGEIYVMTIEDGHLRKLTQDSWANFPAWSPDGKRIAFTAQTVVPPSNWTTTLVQVE